MPARTPRVRRASRRMESLESRCMLSVAEPNNTFAAATTPSDITQFYGVTNYVSNDSVNAAGDADDYYKFFSLYGASHLYAALDGLSADADLYVYGQNQNLLASSRLGGANSETINVDLPANQYYYVRVNAFSGATNYGLYLYNDYAGATMATARDAGVSWGQTSDKFAAFGDLAQIDYLDYRDNVDYFKYQLEAPGTISARVTGQSTLNGTVQLLDSGGNVIATRTGAFSSGFNIFPTSEPAGTYYLKMTQSSGAGQTSVRFVSDYAGDTTATARNLGDLTNSTREDDDMVGSFNTDLASYDDATDLYKFTLDKTAPVFANLAITEGLKPPTFDANLRVARDANNDGFIESTEILDQSNNDAGTGNDSLSVTLPAGTYYAVVVADGAYTSYTLDLDSDLDGVPASTNNLTAATNLGSLSGETFGTGGLVGYIGDTSDFYKFTMTAPGTLLASASVNPAYSRAATPLSLQLLQDKNGNGLFDGASETVGAGATGTLNTTLAAGTYYLRVSNAAIEQAYDLRVVSDYAGGTLSTARPLAAISGATPPPQTFNDYVEENFGATSDVDDVYKFVLPGTYTATLKTTGVAGEDLVLQLVQDANNNGNIDAGDVIAASDAPDSPNETIVKSLAAGTYFIRVHGVNGGTNYALTAAFAGAATPTPTPTGTKLTGTTIGTAGSYANLPNTIAKATDGNLSTFFDGPTPNGDYVGLDLGSAHTITGIAYASRNGFASRMNGGVFQASNSANFASPVNLYTVGATANPGSTALTTQSVNSGGAYRYVRYLGANGSYGDVAEVQFFGGTAAAPLAKFTGTVIGTGGSYGNLGNTIARAFDGNASTFFDGPAANGDWAGLDLGSAKVVKQVIYTPRAGFGSRMVGGKIQVSNVADFSSGVVTLATITTAPTGQTTLALANSAAYRYVRYLTGDGGYGDVADLEFDG